MLIHHLWGFPERIAAPLWSDLSSGIFIYCTGRFGYFCVSIFSFLAGYAWGVMSEESDEREAAIKKLVSLFQRYWRVFILYIPVALIACRNQNVYCNQADLCNRYSSVRLSDLFLNFFGMSCSFNSEWWYISYYVIMTIAAPFLLKLVRKIPCWLSIVLSALLPQFFSAFLVGMVYAQHKLFIKITEKIQPNLFFDTLFLVVVVPLKTLLEYNHVISGMADIILVPLLIVVTNDILNRSKYVQRIFSELGNKSTTMWFTHSFYIYYFETTAKLITCSKSAIISLITFVVLTYGVAYLIDTLYAIIFQKQETVYS